MIKWFLFPILLFASPQEELFQIFGISTVAEAKALWLQEGKERWEFEKRYEHLRPQVWPLFEKMGMLQEIAPSKDHYETVLVFGALLNRVKDRVDYLIQTQVTFDQIVFLTGDRPLLASEKERLPGLQTETEMVKWVYEQSEIPKQIPVHFVVVPMKGTQRPNTLDTLAAWLSTHPLPCACLAISNQPYVHYQEAIVRSVVPFEVEVAGPAVLGDPSVDLMLDTLAREYNYGSSTHSSQ